MCKIAKSELITSHLGRFDATIRALVAFNLLTVFLFASVLGQADQVQPERGSKLGNAYAISDFETINTTNGNLMFNFMFGGLPAGRGHTGARFNLFYNSKLWETRTLRIRDETKPCDPGEPEGPINCPHYNKTVVMPSAKGGWQLGTVFRLEFEDRRNKYGLNPPNCRTSMGVPGTYWTELTWIHKLRVVFPDGSSKEMIPYGHSDALFDRYYRVDINGTVENCGGMPTQTSRPVYYSVDGSFLRLETTTVNDWILYLPDGGRVVNSNSEPQRVYDRNGNYVVLSGNAVTDEFGRSITLTHNQLGDSLITSKGFDGEELIWTIKWKNIGVRKHYIACYPDCPEIEWNVPLEETIPVVDEIVQPQQLGGRSYVFSYNAPDFADPMEESEGWGEINGVELPSGATIGYAYLMDGRGSAEEPELPDGILRNSPVAKVVQYLNEHDGFGSQTTETWTYSTSPTLSSVYSPDGSLTTTWYQDVQSESWDAGLVYKTVSSNGSMVENIWGRNTPVACGQGNNSCSGKPNNPYIKTSFTSIRNASGDFVLTAIKDFDNDKNGNILEVREYDWVPYSSVPRDQYGRITGIPGDAILKRVTKTEYYNPTPHASSTIYNDPDSYHLSSSKRLLGLVKSVEMLDSSLNPRSRSEMTYDYTDYDSSNTKGGNATLTKVWDSYKGGQYRAYSNPLTSTNSITTSVTYNQYGMPLTTTDANGNVTQFSYGAIQSPNGPVYDLYPTQTVTAYGTNIARTTATQYDFYTGLVTSTMDIDNGVSTVTEYDALGRPTKVRAAANTPLESWTRTEYSDVHRRVVVRSDVEALGDGRKVSIQHYDQLGRVRLARTLEDPQSEDPYNEQHGIKVETRYKTVSGYTYQLTSNPFRANYSTSETDPTMGWTLSTAWSNGRRSEVETFAGAALPVAFGGNNANSTGIVRTDIDANRTLVTDQAGKKRRSITNALGQLIRVDEPDAAGNLGPVSNPVQPTYYSYNTLGKMVRVQQGVQNRYFMYDSLGRLLRVRQPEQTVNTALNTSGNPDNNSWTIGFTYDNNGNLLTSRDANNVVITSTYDALNRQLTRSYSDSTPTVTYTYDDSQVPYSKGRVTKIASSVSETRYTEYDLAGRLEKSEQRTDGAVYPSEYKYNLAGALIEQTYPSGRVVKNVLDANGDISMIQSKRNANFGFHNYAKHFAYTPSGVIQHLQLGNGLWESAVMNSRNQVLELKMGNSPTNGGLMHLTYEYGEFGTDGNVDVTKNAGNIVRQTISFNGLANPFVQRYKYDSLDRITEAKETVNGGQTWIQTFGYDRYGNRTSHSETVQGQAKQINEVTLPAVDAATNRFSNTANYQFDAVGNLIVDAHGRQFVFNGDNKQVQVRDQYNNIVGEYVYDGNAKRIKKITASETVVFVYDGFAKLIGEYSTDGPTQSPMVHYTATDPLGSPRVLTNENGVIISRRDFMPFGEEIAPDTNHRTATHKYGVGDNVRQKFTGYERDEETGLDFAEARYYYNNHGRFTAVDPLLASGKSANPQTFNRYAYTMNRPLILTDPTGLQAGTPVKVEITVPETKVYINEKISDGKKNQYFSGVGAIITIKLTDAEGRPLSGATVSESNVRKAGSGSITENKGAVPLGESGETRDIVGKGEITNTPQTETTEDDVPGVTEFFNSTPFTSTTEQTLTVKTSDGGIYNVITERTITNVGRDGKLNTDLNGNGLNTVVTVSPAKVTVVRAPDPPKSLEPKMLNQ